jgi:Tol biopolymer transport system component
MPRIGEETDPRVGLETPEATMRATLGSTIVGVLVLSLASLCACSSGTSTSPGSSAAAPTPRTTTPTGHTAASPLASATGWLAYQTTGPAADHVHLVRVDGTDDHVVGANLAGRTAHPDFSRDGRRLVVDQLSSEDSVDQIYVGDADGTGLHIIARCTPPGCLDHWEPAWSPDSRSLAVSTGSGGLAPDGPARFGIVIVDIATNAVRTLIDHPRSVGQDHFARWSPQADRLVFWRERPGPDGSMQTAIFVVAAKGGTEKQLTPWNLDAGDPDWSSDGSSILFSTHPLLSFPDRARSELYLMRPDGTGMRAVTSNGAGGSRATQPRWVPGGAAIVYVRTGPDGSQRHIWAMTVDAAQHAPILDAGLIYTHPTLQPNA